MPGLIGYIKQSSKENTDLNLKSMAEFIQPEDRFNRELFEQEAVGLGRVSLGILNPHPQPVWNDDRSLGIILEGEFYNVPELRKDLDRHGHSIHELGDAEIALHLYRDLEREFVDRIKGAFVLAIWDQPSAS